MQGVCMKTLNGNTFLAKFTTANGHQGANVKAIVGVGNAYWVWPSLSNMARIVAADFTGAPVAKANINDTLADINAITVAPEDVLTWSDPAE